MCRTSKKRWKWFEDSLASILFLSLFFLLRLYSASLVVHRIKFSFSLAIFYVWILDSVVLLSNLKFNFFCFHPNACFSQAHSFPCQCGHYFFIHLCQLTFTKCADLSGLPGSSDSKEFTCNAGDLGSIPGWEDPWRRAWQPPPVFLPGESP